MFEEIKAKVRQGMDRTRQQMDQMRVNASLLKMELRDRKDEVLADLESAYEDVDEKVKALSNATEDKARQARDAAVSAWETLKRKIHAATAPDEQDTES